uniref:Single stranded DNA binding protein 3a n=1 Tax=Cyprinus carpio TaxID=7962 RepID=A0A8C1RDV1_CYPCA
MFAKGKGTAVPSDGQAREKLALYVYEYLLHVGAQKSAQTFLSEIRWEKNITLGEPPGFLHSWCVFWDLYCAAPERRDTCDHSSEAKAFHDYSAAAAPSPVLGNMPPGDSMPGGPMPPGFFQGPPGSQPSPHTQLPLNSNMMGAHGQPFMSPRYAGGPRPLLRMGNPVGGQPLPPNMIDPTRPTGKRLMGSVFIDGDSPLFILKVDFKFNLALSFHFDVQVYSTNSGENLYTLINSVPPGGNRSNFPMGPGSDGPMGGLEPHHMNGSLGSGDIDGLPKNSPNNLSSMSNPPGTPRDDSELGGSFLHSFQNENYSPTMTMSM